MAELAQFQVNEIWMDRHKFEEAEYKYQEYLVRNNSKGESKTVKENNIKVAVATNKVETTAGRVAQQIAEARKQIQETLKDSYSSTASSGANAGNDTLKSEIQALRKEQSKLVDQVSQLSSLFEKLESRLSSLEGAAPQPPLQNKPPQEKPKDDDDDDDDDDDEDLFASDDEDDEEAERIKAERIAAYNERKSKKTAVIAKSSIILDVKPWDDETDMVELEKLVRSVECEGLLWGASKLVKIAYGILKLQISCVVEDDKVGTDFLEEEITKFEDFIQSVDIVAFNKI